MPAGGELVEQLGTLCGVGADLGLVDCHGQGSKPPFQIFTGREERKAPFQSGRTPPPAEWDETFGERRL